MYLIGGRYTQILALGMVLYSLIWNGIWNLSFQMPFRYPTKVKVKMLFSFEFPFLVWTAWKSWKRVYVKGSEKVLIWFFTSNRNICPELILTWQWVCVPVCLLWPTFPAEEPELKPHDSHGGPRRLCTHTLPHRQTTVPWSNRQTEALSQRNLSHCQWALPAHSLSQ